MALAISLLGGIVAPAAENSPNSENSPPAEQPAFSARHPFLARLLNWPEKEKTANGDGDQDQGEEEPLESDRPDITEASSTVGFRRLQIEGGYKYILGVGGERGHSSHDLPELLVRYGLAERLELRIAWDQGVVFDRPSDPHSGRAVTDVGLSDLTLGFKYALSKQDHWRPQSAFIASLAAPVGSPSQTSGQTDATFNYLYSWKLSKKLPLNCSTGGQWTGEAEDRFWRFFQTVSAEYELTPKLHVFNEWACFVRCDSRDNRPETYYDAGVTYLITPNLQLDWSFGLGLSEAADRFFTGCGVSARR